MTRHRVHSDKVEQRVAHKVDDIELRAEMAEVLKARWTSNGEAMTPEQLSVWIERMAHSPLGTSHVALQYLRTLSHDMGVYRRTGPAVEDLVHRLARIQIAFDVNQAADAGDPDLVWCESHGWTDLLGLPACAECPCEMPTGPMADLDRIGRPRRYCSNACRQRAYRRRRRNRHRARFSQPGKYSLVPWTP